MKYVDEFRDADKAQSLLREIDKLVARIDICRHRPLSIMEVCGGHTHAIFKFGIETMLSEAFFRRRWNWCTGRAVRCVCCPWGAWTIAWRLQRHPA